MSLMERTIVRGSLSESQKKQLQKRVQELLLGDVEFIDNVFYEREVLRDRIKGLLKRIVSEDSVGLEEDVDDNLVTEILQELFGLGIIEKYLQDREVTDILIQDTEMAIIKDGRTIHLGQVFEDGEEVRKIIDRIKAFRGKTIDSVTPFLDVDLYDGSRCHIIIPPIADRIYISIRVFNCPEFTIKDLVDRGAITAFQADFLRWAVVEEKMNILVAGPMGSGKTVFINTLARLIGKNEKINIIQDVPEITLKNHKWVRILTTRAKSREVDNRVTQEELLIQSLRMRADRIILGEVRDPLASYQLLQVLNTGHKGSFSTIHADSARDAIYRLESLATEHRPNLNQLSIRNLISRVINLVIYLGMDTDEDNNVVRRKVMEMIRVKNKLNGGDFLFEELEMV